MQLILYQYAFVSVRKIAIYISLFILM